MPLSCCGPIPVSGTQRVSHYTLPLLKHLCQIILCHCIALMSRLAPGADPVIALEEFSMISLHGVSQMEVSREEGASWSELITLALKQDPRLFSCFPVKERDSMEFCSEFLKEKFVATTPGKAFGKSFDTWIRLSYATSMENIEEAMKRLKDFIGSH